MKNNNFKFIFLLVIINQCNCGQNKFNQKKILNYSILGALLGLGAYGVKKIYFNKKNNKNSEDQLNNQEQLQEKLKGQNQDLNIFKKSLNEEEIKKLFIIPNDVFAITDLGTFGKIYKKLKEKIDQYSSIIFEGPPGTGKTLIASLFAFENKQKIFKITADFLETNDLKTVLKVAKELSNANENVILFFDEADCFLGNSIDEYNENELENLKSFIEFLKEKNEKKHNITIFMATNNLVSLNSIILNESLSLNFPNLKNERHLNEILIAIKSFLLGKYNKLFKENLKDDEKEKLEIIKQSSQKKLNECKDLNDYKDKIIEPLKKNKEINDVFKNIFSQKEINLLNEQKFIEDYKRSLFNDLLLNNDLYLNKIELAEGELIPVDKLELKNGKIIYLKNYIDKNEGEKIGIIKTINSLQNSLSFAQIEVVFINELIYMMDNDFFSKSSYDRSACFKNNFFQPLEIDYINQDKFKEIKTILSNIIKVDKLQKKDIVALEENINNLINKIFINQENLKLQLNDINEINNIIESKIDNNKLNNKFMKKEYEDAIKKKLKNIFILNKNVTFFIQELEKINNLIVSKKNKIKNNNIINIEFDNIQQNSSNFLNDNNFTILKHQIEKFIDLQNDNIKDDFLKTLLNEAFSKGIFFASEQKDQNENFLKLINEIRSKINQDQKFKNDEFMILHLTEEKIENHVKKGGNIGDFFEFIDNCEKNIIFYLEDCPKLFKKRTELDARSKRKNLNILLTKLDDFKTKNKKNKIQLFIMNINSFNMKISEGIKDHITGKIIENKLDIDSALIRAGRFFLKMQIDFKKFQNLQK